MEQNKISRRNFLRVAGASATAAAMSGLVPAASAAGIKDLWSMDLQILATSDTHGKFDPWDYAANKADASGSVAQQATAIKENRTKTTLVVDAGDTIQANSAELFLNDDVHPMIAAQNAIGYDVYVTGNHEYNYGMATLEKVLSQQKAKVLTGNVYSPEGKPLADGYTIINKGSVKIGVIGMVTPNITRWDAKNLEGWTVTNPVDESRKIIDKIKNDVDVIIGVMHMDVDNEYGVYGSGVTDLANACPEFDVIVAAHGHKSIPNKMINGVLVVENKNAGATVSDIHVYLERGLNGKWKVKNRTSENLTIKDYAPDPELTALLAEYDQRAKDDAVTPIGQLVGGDLAPKTRSTPAAGHGAGYRSAGLHQRGTDVLHRRSGVRNGSDLHDLPDARGHHPQVRHGKHLHLPEHPVQAADERLAAASVHGVVCCLLQDLGAGRCDHRIRLFRPLLPVRCLCRRQV